MASIPQTTVPPETYLELDRKAEVKSELCHVEHYRREGEFWILAETQDRTATLELPGLECVLPLDEAYDRLILP